MGLIFTGLLALFSWLMGGLAYKNIYSFLDNAEKTQGQIIAFEPQRKVFKPVVQFYTSKGDTIQFVAPIGSADTSQVKTGSLVKVLYHPQSPKDAVIEDFWYTWTNVIMILVFGTLPFLGLLLLRFILKSPVKKS